MSRIASTWFLIKEEKNATEKRKTENNVNMNMLMNIKEWSNTHFEAAIITAVFLSRVDRILASARL